MQPARLPGAAQGPGYLIRPGSADQDLACSCPLCCAAQRAGSPIATKFISIVKEQRRTHALGGSVLFARSNRTVVGFDRKTKGAGRSYV